MALVPAPDYAPALGSRGSARWTGALVGAGSAIAPFEGFNDSVWWAAEGRDAVAIAHDFWTVIGCYTLEHAELATHLVEFDAVHPDQQQLFGMDELVGAQA